MSNTADLIASLSAEAKSTSKVRAPSYWSIRLLAVLTIYAIGCQLFLGLRADLPLQLVRPLFALETLLLTLLLLTSAIAATLAMYPDVYQRPGFLKLPYIVFALLAMLMCFQLWMPIDSRMVIPLNVPFVLHQPHSSLRRLCLFYCAKAQAYGNFKQDHSPC
jgi:hypothetical protein